MAFVTEVAGHLTPYAYESIIVSTTVKKLDASKITPSDFKTLGKARLVRLTVEGKIRFREDPGSNVTGTDGHELRDGDVYDLGGFQQMSNFNMIRHSTEAADATVRVTYYR